ncbi:MAG: hypothetical protein AAF363_05285 [Bacteroidota bacterium]
MKTLYSILFTLVMFAWNTANAQNYVFKVLANRGESQVKTDGSWKPVKTGSTLNNGDELKVTEDAYIGLVHKTGKTYELKNAGLVDINELASNLNSSSSSVASKYADFVLNKMTASNGGNLTATGAVTRAVDGQTPLKVFTPSTVEVLNPEAKISWSNVEDNATYVVTLKNMFDEVIMEEETQKTAIDLNFETPGLKDERLVIMNVSLKGSEDIKSGDIGIQRLAGEDAKPVMDELEGLKAETTDGTAMSYLVLASFYENNNLLVDALTSYEKAIEISPDVEDFVIMRNNFIERNNLNK